MHVVVIGASDDDAVDVGVGNVLGRVDAFEVREDLKDGLPLAVVAGLEVGPTIVVVMHVVELIKGGIYYSC